jgi:hypothetical protein
MDKDEILTLILIFLITSEAEHFFTWSFGIRILSFCELHIFHLFPYCLSFIYLFMLIFMYKSVYIMYTDCIHVWYIFLYQRYKNCYKCLLENFYIFM